MTALKLPILAAGLATANESGDSEDSVAAVQDASRAALIHPRFTVPMRGQQPWRRSGLFEPPNGFFKKNLLRFERLSPRERMKLMESPNTCGEINKAVGRMNATVADACASTQNKLKLLEVPGLCK